MVAVAVAVAALYVHYVLALFALLNSAALAKVMNPRPERARVAWTLAWSEWPGRLNVRGLRIVGQGLEIQWELAVARAGGDVRLLPLLQRRFEADDVHASGASLRLRPTVEPTAKRLRQAEAFPPIAGVADPPLRYEGPLHPPEEKAWAIQLHHARIHAIDELWIGPHRARGGGWLEGTLHTRAGWSVSFEAQGALTDVTVSIGEREVLSGGGAELRASLQLPDIPHTHGPDRLRGLSGSLRARSEEVSLAIVGQHAPELADPIRGEGALELSAALSGGELLPGSTLRFTGSDGSYALHRDWAVQAPHFVLEAEVAPSRQTKLTVSAAPLSLASRGEVLLTSPRLELRLDAPNGRVLPPLPDPRLTVALERTGPAPVSRFQPWLEGLPFRLTDGTLGVELQAKGTSATAPAGDARVWLSGVRGHFPDGRFAGDVTLQLSLGGLRPRERVADFSGSKLAVSGLKLENAEGRVEDWSGTLTLEEAALRFDSLRLLGTLKGAATDARPLLLLAKTAKPLRQVLLSKELTLRAELDLSPQRQIVPRFELAGTGLRLRGGALRDQRGVFGALLARVHGVPMGATLKGEAPDLSVAVGEAWLEEQLRETGVTQAMDAAGLRGTGGAGAAP